MRLLDKRDCIEKTVWEEGDILVLDVEEVLVEEYQKQEFQLFRCGSGAGLDPSNLGKRIYGNFVADGEYSSYKRHNFFGVINPEKLKEITKK